MCVVTHGNPLTYLRARMKTAMYSLFFRLQKFKLLTANTVISSENAAMETMGTEQLLDLFQLSSGQSQPQPGPSTGKSVLEALPDLWDDKQYEEEYDMTNFIKGLNKMNP